MKKHISEKEIDRLVILEANDETKWEQPIKVGVRKTVSSNSVNKPSPNGTLKNKVRRPARLG